MQITRNRLMKVTYNLPRRRKGLSFHQTSEIQQNVNKLSV